ncbi:MAG: hypothetical protein J6T57_00665 [Alphaproteobacteria bacterium]|nr:hypothetical protein [Alphaproteobacteria bacterium]
MKDNFINCIADLEQAVRDTSYSLEKKPYIFDRTCYQLKQYDQTVAEAVISQWGLSTFRYKDHFYAKRSEITAVIDKDIETQLIDGFRHFNRDREDFLQQQKQGNFEHALKECYDLIESAKQDGSLQKIKLSFEKERFSTLDEIWTEYIPVYTAIIDGAKREKIVYSYGRRGCDRLEYNGVIYNDKDYNFNCLHGKMLEVKMKWSARAEMGARA